ncbi:Retrovirus-related Pol polyprotein LINE-1 [Gossypium australe]|uniref:Retrovirus-related Pol polyprotein LINE-1 n=1 Tax=Gossypium australe TaxID=47621 RepID=A0A5B6WF36_9ROSI|nr:Retrovirus-related Pol polyprotein LINE-1 [Gossypium australe]
MFRDFSGLNINFHKSCLVGFGMEEEFLLRMLALCQYKVGKPPFNYLGIPLGVDPRKIATLDPIVERFHKKLSRWKSQSLSFAARVVIINLLSLR